VRSSFVGSIVAALLCALPFAATAADDCAAGLVPNVEISRLDDSSRYSFVSLIDETNYEQAKRSIKASADISLLSLIKIGDADATYEQFDEKRRHYLSSQAVNYQRDYNAATLRYSVPTEARKEYFDCVMGSHGLQVSFKDEDATHATARVSYRPYRSDPESIRFHIHIAEGSSTQRGVTNPHTIHRDGDYAFDVTRPTTKVIRVIVNAESVSLSASAVSVPPPEPRSPSSPGPEPGAPSYDLCYFRTQPDGNPYVKTYTYGVLNLHRSGPGGIVSDARADALRNAGFSVERQWVSRTEILPEPLVRIRDVTYGCSGGGCPAITSTKGGYGIDYELVPAKNGFTWHRSWDGEPAIETYTVLYEQARRACVSNCQGRPIDAPVCTGDRYTH